METRTITDAWLRTVKPPATGRLEVRDAKVSGLIVRITAKGTISYSARRVVNGRHSRVTLGSGWPATGIAEARKLALPTIVDFHTGVDPIAERRAALIVQARTAVLPTVAQRLDEWQVSRVSGWSPRHAAEIARVARRDIIPALGDRALVETGREDWTALVAAKRRTAPAMGALLYRIISAFLSFGEASGWLPYPLLPRRGGILLAPGPKARERTLTDAELVSVWRGAGLLSERSCALIRLLILTGARLNEVAGMRPAEIDRSAAIWRLPAARAKNQRSYAVPLSALALAEIDACGCTPRNGALSKLKRQLDVASGVENWRLHDLRRSVRTGLSKLGVRREVAERAVNHIGGASGLVSTYEIDGYEHEALAALHRWQAHVATLVSPPRADVVVPLRGRQQAPTTA